MSDLYEMMPGDRVAFRHLGNRGPSFSGYCNVDEKAQCVVGICGEAHSKQVELFLIYLRLGLMYKDVL
jgi:hypothetical protein